jgi:hypothetical protein
MSRDTEDGCLIFALLAVGVIAIAILALVTAR